jgi:hypothetical protein
MLHRSLGWRRHGGHWTLLRPSETKSRAQQSLSGLTRSAGPIIFVSSPRMPQIVMHCTPIPISYLLIWSRGRGWRC